MVFCVSSWFNVNDLLLLLMQFVGIDAATTTRQRHTLALP
jgi:hypothetical protein